MYKCEYHSISHYMDKSDNDVVNMHDLPSKFIWEDCRKELFIEALGKADIDVNYSMTEQLPSPEVINDATTHLTNIIITAASQTLRRRPNRSTQGTKYKKKYPRYFDPDCFKKLKDIKKMSKKLSKDPQNYALRQTYYYNKRQFRKHMKSRALHERKTLIDKLYENNSPKDFWKTVEKLKKDPSKKDHKNPISPGVWLQHFQSLMCKDDKTCPPITSEDHQVSKFLANEENWHIFNELNYKINDKEILESIQGLKKGKACGLDLISNEMIKAGSSILLSPLNNLFNRILQSGHYPQSWNGSLLSPLHKGGDITNPDKYRGISLMSCLGKLFCAVLNRRLTLFMQKNNIGSKFQCGFSENCRTSDHLLTLKTLTDKYRQNNKKLYTCFIDFKKAFDTVWRDGLFYKMLQNNIGGSFAKLIQNMYSNTYIQIKLDNKVSEPFHDNIGVKQGCMLSPSLFKLFIGDLPDCFDNECMPAKLVKESVNCLMFADDVVLISETKEGLQNALDRLDIYSKKWKLTVNTEKTKVMIFSKSGKLTVDNFLLNNTRLDIVKTYTYLGIDVHATGSFSNAMQTLCKKAQKALFKLKSCIYQGSLDPCIYQANLAPNISLYLFDAMIRPIYTYGSDIWGAFINNTREKFNINSNKYMLFDKHCTEQLEIKFMKGILGVHKKSSNAACRGELGRYPSIIYIMKQMLNNWIRIAKYNTESLLYDTYMCNHQLLGENKSCWLSSIK